MTQQKLTMYQLEKNLIDELNQDKKELLKDKYPEEMLYGYINSNVPFYNVEKLQLACDDLWLGYPSEDGLSAGSTNAYDIIANNIYEKLEKVALDWLKSAKQQKRRKVA